MSLAEDIAELFEEAQGFAPAGTREGLRFIHRCGRPPRIDPRARQARAAAARAARRRAAATERTRQDPAELQRARRARRRAALLAASSVAAGVSYHARNRGGVM